MKKSTMFPGDDDEFVKSIQRRLYDEWQRTIFSIVRNYYTFPSEGLSRVTLLRDRTIETVSFAHEPLRRTYDQVAAYFRFKYAADLLPLLPGISPKNEADRVEENWLAYLKGTIAIWSLQEDEMASNILMAVCYPHSPWGLAAERKLNRMLREEYEEMYAYRPTS